MFFKELFSIFKQDSLLDTAYKRSHQMLLLTSSMYTEARQTLREKDTNQLGIDVFQKDSEINKFEREVRRDLIRHLTVAGTDEFNSALVLATIVIDIERLGDYSKNLVDLARVHPARLNGGVFNEDLVKVEEAVMDSYQRVPLQFESSDTVDAEKLINDYSWVNKVCDQHVNDYIAEVDKDIPSGSAVALALYFRYLKRVNSHLMNIATSIINPIDQIGFTHSILTRQKEKKS